MDLTRVVPVKMIRAGWSLKILFDFRNNNISEQSGCGKERENSQGYLLLF